MIKVETGIAMPEEKRVTKLVYPYEGMNVGDSFFVEGEGKNLLAMVCNRNGSAGKKLGKKFTARKVEGGVRVWRTE